MNKEKINIEISKELFDTISKRITESSDEFSTVSDYVEYVLRELVMEKESSSSPYSKEEEEEIKNKLKTLGYI